MHGGDLRCTMLGERLWRLALLAPAVLDIEAAGDDPQAIFVDEDRPSDLSRLGRHRVRRAFEHHLGCRTDEDGHAEREVFRKDLDRPKARELLDATSLRNHAGGPRGRPHVHLDVPICKLSSKVLLVDELAVFEERALHPADQTLDGALLLAAPRRAHLDADPDVDNGLREHRVELFDRAPLACRLHDVFGRSNVGVL
jgi:hypothetical protein